MYPHYSSGMSQQHSTYLSSPSNCPPQQQYSSGYPPTHGYQTLRPPPLLNTSYQHGNYSMNRTSSHSSSDSGYATRPSSSVTSPTQPSLQIHGYPAQSYSAQSYPTQSYPAQGYATRMQLSQQGANYPYGNQRSPDIELVRTAPISSKHKERKLSTPSPTSPSEYPCLYPHCGHISSRFYDLKRHMTVHFPPAADELLDCRYEWCGRTGLHGFKREDHRKEHYRKVHMKVSEYPKTGKGGGSGRKSRP